MWWKATSSPAVGTITLNSIAIDMVVDIYMGRAEVYNWSCKPYWRWLQNYFDLCAGYFKCIHHAVMTMSTMTLMEKRCA